jgi:DNA-binding transcriptional LysR family regulator
MLDGARSALVAVAAARDSVQAVLGLLRGSLRVGGIPTPGLFDQAMLLAKFRDLHPGVDISYVRETSMALIPDVQSSRIDVAFVSFPRRLPKGVRSVPLVTEPLMFVCRPDHPLGDRKRIAVKALIGEQFIDAPKGSVAYQTLNRVFTSARTERRVPYQVNDVFTTLDFVAAGLGVALERRSITRLRPELRAIPLADKTMTWTLAAVVSRDHLTQVARAFLELVLEQSLQT